MRSTQAPQPARLFASGENGALRVELQAPEAGVATGQACVFYANSDPQARVLGGGWIAATAISAMDADANRSAAAGLRRRRRGACLTACGRFLYAGAGVAE